MSKIRLVILGWEAKGLRCPDHEVVFLREGGDAVFPVSLLQMPNGTGKTTTLSLLRAAFVGATAWNAERIKALRKNDKVHSGEFILSLSINERRHTLKQLFDFRVNSVHFKTTIGTGEIDGHSLPQEIQTLFRSEFVKYFIFDGELATQLLDGASGNARFVIQHLYHLNYLQEIAEKIEWYWGKKTEGKTASEIRGLNRRRGHRRRLFSRLEALEHQKELESARLNDVINRLNTLKEEFASQLESKSSHDETIRDITTRLSAASEKVETLTRELLVAMRSPEQVSMAFAQDMLELKDHLDRVKLPESAGKEFFVELAGEADCVCGRILDDQARIAILDRSKTYLGNEETAFLNSIKTAIGDHVLGMSTPTLVETTIEELQRAEDHRQLLQGQYDREKSIALSTNPELSRVNEEIGKLEGEKKELEIKLKRYTNPDIAKEPQNRWNLNELKHELEKADRDLAEVTETYDLNLKKALLNELLRSALAQAQEEISLSIRDKSNAHIQKLLPNNLIEIEKVDSSLKLKGKEGGSVGENLAVAYSFLSTLFQENSFQMPFVVDSPAGALDLEVRREVGALLPKLSEQVIAFTITSERDGFVPGIQDALEKDIQYVTIYRKGDERGAPGRALDFLETEDGIVVEGESFFNNFQLEIEK